MIRSALIALGLSAGAAGAQGMVPTAPVVDSCGGNRLVLAASSNANVGELEHAAEVISARIGGLYGGVFDFTDVVDDKITVSIPSGMPLDRGALEPLLEQVEFGFLSVLELSVLESVSHSEIIVAPEGHSVLRQKGSPSLVYVVKDDPVLDGTAIVAAEPSFDQNGAPAVIFRFSDASSQTFGEYTAEHIGEPFAIVLRGEVISAPTIQSAIWGGSGIINGLFTVEEAEQLATLMQAGVLPFGLDILSEDSVDGSDPSADFCP
ncbi:preprotein translocase subunit SecD [Octadecabacter temperatus]|uniref:Preprotein translocase subunit SecD n=1 Tax=Octadecabacter temperatus TaxID=1458307 RepID=A0A0K0Y6J6_9RHOB|nr:hypothetical protein [Octadecabacter temperatus]AKS46540.1 preprotein translocase subunit SecD [Octadecabacter temperatus]SIO16192.1 preprotein translocase subunit SecD [Octadecabacter temperatus]